MATSTKIRPFSRLLDKATVPFWVIGPDGRLAFLSGSVGRWLKIDPESLVGRLCVAGTSISDDPLDFLAASLAAPPGLSARGTASLVVQPTFPGARSGRVEPMDTRFVRMGERESSMTLAVAGNFVDQLADPIVDAAIALRQQLDNWRRHHALVASGISVGSSRSAIRIQKQIELAGSVRSDLIIQSPQGCFAESIATSVHQSSAPGEPVATIEGPLMDAELLDASLGVVLNHLAESEKTTATAMLKGVDETPPEAQQRLAVILEQFGDRLRLIAISDRFVKTIRSDSDETSSDTEVFQENSLPVGIHYSLADRLCGLCIRLSPLAERVEDIPVIATSLLDRRKVAGDAVADRFARAALDALVIYPWPDNLRELDQAIRHASRTCPGQVIDPEHLPLAIRSYRPNESTPVDQQEIDLDQVVAEFESDLIRKTLSAAGGNRAEAARRLNISRARLLRKLESIQDGEDV